MLSAIRLSSHHRWLVALTLTLTACTATIAFTHARGPNVGERLSRYLLVSHSNDHHHYQHHHFPFVSVLRGGSVARPSSTKNSTSNSRSSDATPAASSSDDKSMLHQQVSGKIIEDPSKVRFEVYMKLAISS